MGRKSLSSVERNARNRAIVIDYCHGVPVPVIAERHGLTSRYVNKLMQELGLSRPVGRPKHWPECPPELRPRFLRLRDRMRVPSAEARTVIEAYGAM